MTKEHNYRLFVGSVALIITSAFIDGIFAKTNFLFTLSMILALQIILFNISRDKVFFADPLFVFSFLYFGYSVGGVYYSFSERDFGKFLEFVNIDRSEIQDCLVYSLIYANICYLFIALGYKLVIKKNNNFYEISRYSSFSRLLVKMGWVPILLLILIGLSYWVWVSNAIAGGIWNSLILFQLFPHLVAEHKISIAPYLLYYAGTNIWLMKILAKNKPVNAYFVSFSALGFLISASTARISITLTYVFGQLYLVYMVYPRCRSVIHRIFLTLIVLGFILFFLREMSNHLFLQNENGPDVYEFKLFESFIGGGNVADLQQLVIIYKTFKIDDILLGSSYFDWLYNSISSFFSLKPTSVGLRIADMYVPDTSGAPTPGAIGEAFANFHIFAPIFLFFFGATMAFLKNQINKSKSIAVYFTYSCFVTSFLFLYPKVDSTMIVNFFWNAFPTLFTLALLFFLFQIPRVFPRFRAVMRHKVKKDIEEQISPACTHFRA